jgi:hypothetical protein
MTDYCTSTDAISYLGMATFDATNDTALLGVLITRHSRMIDRKTGRASGFWGPQTAVTRTYSVDLGSDENDLVTSETDVSANWLTIDPFDTITAVTMSTAVDRSDAVTLNLVTPTDPYYVIRYPLNGPPYDRLRLANGPFWPDRFGIGNVQVTGNTSLPDELAHACCLWVAHTWKARMANWAGRIERPDGSTISIDRRPPPDVADILDQFTNDETRVYIW